MSTQKEASSEEHQGVFHLVESVISVARGIFHAATEHIMEPFHNTIHSALRQITDTLLTAATILFGTTLIAIGFAQLLNALIGIPGIGFISVGGIVLVFGILIRMMHNR